MKQLIYSGFIFSLALFAASCDQKGARYIDPNTGTGLNLVQQDSTGMMVNAETGQPVDNYVDRESGDTIYGVTGEVVKGHLNRSEGGRYVYLSEESNAAKESYKGDGSSYVPGIESKEVKRKSDGYKYKGGKGEYRIKRTGYKKEVEKDGDITIKTGGRKIKIDGETGRRKVKKD